MLATARPSCHVSEQNDNVSRSLDNDVCSCAVLETQIESGAAFNGRKMDMSQIAEASQLVNTFRASA